MDKVEARRRAAERREQLFLRRSRMLNLLCLKNSLKSVVDILSIEFSVSKDALYADHQRMDTWAPTVQQDSKLAYLTRGLVDFAARKVVDIILQIGSEKKPATLKEKYLLIQAINTLLRAQDLQLRHALELGVIRRQPLEINQTLVSEGMPWKVDPQIKEALLAESARQRAEYEAIKKALIEKEEKKDSDAAADNQAPA